MDIDQAPSPHQVTDIGDESEREEVTTRKAKRKRYKEKNVHEKDEQSIAKDMPLILQKRKEKMLSKIKNKAVDNNNIVIIEPNPDIDPKGHPKIVQEALNPKVTNIQLEDMRLTASGAVAIKVGSAGERDKLLDLDKIKDGTLKYRSLPQRRPRLLLIRVPRELQPNDLVEQIIERNNLGSNTTKESIRALCGSLWPTPEE